MHRIDQRQQHRVFMMLTFWFNNPGDLKFAEANGRGKCTMSRFDSAWCQPMSKFINSFEHESKIIFCITVFEIVF